MSSEHRRRKLKKTIDGNLERDVLRVEAPFACQIRLIPLTRSGPPSAHLLQSAKDFGYTLIVVDEETAKQPVDSEIPPPDLDIHQVNLEPKLELNFDRPTAREYNVTSIRVQYRPLMSLHLNSPLESNEMMEANGAEEMRNDGKTTVLLRRGLKLVSSF